MSLRAKILVVLLGVFAVYAAAEYGIQRWVIYPGFLAVERDEATMDVERCREAFGREYRHLDEICHDWAAWDDSYAFVADTNGKFIESSLPFESYKSVKLNLIAYFDARGKTVWARAYDLKTGHPLPDADILEALALQTRAPAVPATAESATSGLLMTRRGPLLVASRAIVTSRHTGPVRGTLVMGRFLDDGLVQSLREQTCLNFKVWPLRDHVPPPAVATAIGQITARWPVYLQRTDNRVLHAYATIADLQNRPALALQVEIPRAIVATGRSAIRYGALSLVCAALAASLAILLLLQRIVIRPLMRLTNLVIAIGRSNDLSLRLPLDVQGDDEIGTLAREFNAMCQQLSHARQKLLEQSYYTGLAETSSGVLHNVRNALNPILLNIEALRQELQNATPASPQTDQRAAAAGNLPPDSACDQAHALIRKMKAKFDYVANRASQVEDIIADHDRRADPVRLMETLPLDTLVRESTDLVPDAMLETLSVELNFGADSTPAVWGNRISLLQVFANLFINAAEAVGQAGRERGRIEIEAHPEREHDRPVVHIRFRDNGSGIPKEHLARIFDRGFTTRNRGAKVSGLGLHWCANVVTILGGRMYAESDGPGQGACLHLVLPAEA